MNALLGDLARVALFTIPMTLSVELHDGAGLLGHRERDAAVVLGERIRVKVRVDLLRDRDARVTEDLRQLEDVAARLFAIS